MDRCEVISPEIMADPFNKDNRGSDLIVGIATARQRHDQKDGLMMTDNRIIPGSGFRITLLG